MQYGSFDLVTAGPMYVVLQSTLKSYYTHYLYFFALMYVIKPVP